MLVVDDEPNIVGVVSMALRFHALAPVAGLGVAIVAAVVEAHGGRVPAADAVGGGAQFSVVLPGRTSAG